MCQVEAKQTEECRWEDGSCDRKTECRRWKSGGGGGVMLQQDGGWKGRGESAASGISFREDRGGYS